MNNDFFLAVITEVLPIEDGDCQNYACSWQQYQICDNLSTLNQTKPLNLIYGDANQGLNVAYPINEQDPTDFIGQVVLMRFRGTYNQIYNVFEFIPVAAGSSSDNSCCKVLDVECNNGQLAVTYTDGCITPYSSTTGEPTTTSEPTTSTSTTTPFALDILSSSPLPDGSTTSAYGFTFTAFGGSGTYTNWAITAGSLPPGLSLNATTGLLDGVPSLDGSYSFWVQVTDSLGATFSKLFELDIISPTTTTTTTLAPAVIAYGYFAGDNQYSQFANGGTTGINYPVANASGDIWSAIRTSQYNSIGVTASGNLFTVGQGNRGQIGNGFNSGTTTFTQISGTWISVDTGVQYCLALKSGGNLYSWGSNTDGRLGIGSLTDKNTPQHVVSGRVWVSYSAGSAHAAGIDNFGQLYTWGANDKGQCCYGSGNFSTNQSPTMISGYTNFSSVYCGFNTTAVIKNDGTLWLAGDNTYGQLALNSITASGVPELTQVYGGGTYKLASLGTDHTVVIKTDGSMWLAGRNNVYQLGDGTSVNKNYLVQIASGGYWTKISAGNKFTEAINSGGQCLAWGYNASGECGVGNNTDQIVPRETALGGLNWKFVGATNTSDTFIALKDDSGTTTSTTTTAPTTSTTAAPTTTTSSPGTTATPPSTPIP